MKIKKLSHKYIIAILTILLFVLAFKTYEVSAAPNSNCYQKTQALHEKAKQIYSKDADAASKLNAKTTQGIKARKALNDKINNYISKGLPNECKGNKMPGWKIGLKLFGMVFGL